MPSIIHGPLSIPRRAICERGKLLRCLALAVSIAAAAATPGLTDLSLEDLMQVPVVGASKYQKYQQRQSEVTAAVSVITRQEIKAFGWRTLDQALASLPGVYTTYDRQYVYLGVRGFACLVTATPACWR